MHAQQQRPTPGTSSGSSSQSINQLGMTTTTSTGAYPSNSMSSLASSTSLQQYEQANSDEEELELDDFLEAVRDDEEGEDDHERQGSQGSGQDQADGVQKRKPRITLARGRACVVCRNRKLKCTGERPCRSCEKAGTECRYEELPKRKPKAQLMEERMAQLEAMVGLAPGEPLANVNKRPKPALTSLPTPISADHTGGNRIPSPLTSTSSQSATGPPAPPPLSLHSHRDINTTASTPGLNGQRADVPPNSPLETALITLVLPHTPFLLMPLHPQRFLAILNLPAYDPMRPHPALLYVLFAEAVLILERGTPDPKPIIPPTPLFGSLLTSTLSPPPMNREFLLNNVRGMAPMLLERARAELDNGIRNVDRPFDLARAAVGIARHLYSLGRFIEGWNIPVSRLVISCGLHRSTGNYATPDGSFLPPGAAVDPLPKPYAQSHHYPPAEQSMTGPDGARYPVLRMRPIILPPARDEIDVAERTATFWAAKMQDWEAGCGWGWTTSMADDECTTQWPWGTGVPEPKSAMNRPDDRYGIRDLHDPTSPAQQSPFPDTTYTLALKSLALLHRSSHLFDLPISSYAIPRPDGSVRPTHIPPLAAIKAVESAINMFRARLPPVFAFHPNGSNPNTPSDGSDRYEGFDDPWWIMLHTNLYTAEMMMWKELAHYQQGAYPNAVGCARAMVTIISRIRPDQWAHIDMIVALTISLSSRFLYKEADRLTAQGDFQSAALASEEGETLRLALAGEYSKWLPMASLHGLIVQRVREGWAEKEGEYERM